MTVEAEDQPAVERPPDAPRMMEHPVGIIIASHSPPKGIRFTINKELFQGFPGFEEMPDRLLGEIDQWTASSHCSIRAQRRAVLEAAAP